MGLGKTIQAIAFLTNYKFIHGCKGPFLVVCPLTLVDNWLSEFKKFSPNIKCERYAGDRDVREGIQDR